jgi:hypothetical protein
MLQSLLQSLLQDYCLRETLVNRVFLSTTGTNEG